MLAFPNAHMTFALPPIIGGQPWQTILSNKVPASLATICLSLLWHFLYQRSNNRTRVVPPSNERVLILGASSGIGRCIALQYAARGARICLVARREVELKKVMQECLAQGSNMPGQVVMLVGDFSQPADLVEIRAFLQTCRSF